MCGIVGFTGDAQAAPILLYGLERLEYRGYDSAGITVNSGAGTLLTEKASGRLANLAVRTDNGTTLRGTCGIGHTRWATHGEPTDNNAHPHVASSGKISIVHNGIIENYRKLKDWLLDKGVKFHSETDTEVVSQLIDYYYEGDLLNAVRKAVYKLEGSYALGIVAADEPSTIIGVRKEGPLIAAYTEDAAYLASDVTAILKYCRDVIYLEDDSIVVIKPGSVTCYNKYGKVQNLTPVTIDWDIEAAQKGGYAHYMLKEIYEQPRVLRDTLAGRITEDGGSVNLSEAGLTREILRSVRKVHIVGCGSAYHAGVVAKYQLESFARIACEVTLASEFRYSSPVVQPGTLCVVISQSGETADSIAALREAKSLGVSVLAVVNVRGSTISREADYVLYTNAGPEIAVATSKAYSAQVAAMTLLAIALAEFNSGVNRESLLAVLGDLRKLPDLAEKVLADVAPVQLAASRYFNRGSVFFIGRGLDYAAALEASLKLKEISYIHSEAYAGGELKHGTISLIEPGTLVVAVALCSKLAEKIESNIKEVKTRGAEVLAVTSESLAGDFADSGDIVITVPDTHELLTPLLAALPLQLFAYYTALNNGCDIDKPRNLAKSVTVE
ncbi:MAG: glutamine--fructose-6-phosphate transaminase (isomerizing) [Oscillospiraceae bacterium]|jgi:glucosamine--fructose-6-phosphate aminotransferase (isomerizing)|nr:glutamine--fructose-6-phosphate transaminase (isomerizing) [Oscillospiraceae bacterium]